MPGVHTGHFYFVEVWVLQWGVEWEVHAVMRGFANDYNVGRTEGGGRGPEIGSPGTGN